MNLLEKTEALFHSARKSIIEAGMALKQCLEEDAWQEKYDTQGQFVEALGMSSGAASRLLTVCAHYESISPAKLAKVGVEKLYLATSLKGTPKEQFIKAESLSKTEIKAQRIYEDTGEECAHEETYTICKTCHHRTA